LSGVTYATANLTSVSKRFTPANVGCATLLVIGGVGLGILGLLSVSSATDGAAEALGYLLFIAAVSGVLVFAGRQGQKGAKPTYHMVFSTSAGEVQALASTDQEAIDRFIGAISPAINARG
jgi:hypothetical protein